MVGTLNNHKIIHQVRIFLLLFADALFSEGGIFTSLKRSEKFDEAPS